MVLQRSAAGQVSFQTDDEKSGKYFVVENGTGTSVVAW